MPLKRIMRRKRTPDVTIYVTDGFVSAFIPGDGSTDELSRLPVETMTAEEIAAHERWEEEETAKWLAWAKATDVR